jgi:hypothetical protein
MGRFFSYETPAIAQRLPNVIKLSERGTRQMYVDLSGDKNGGVFRSFQKGMK